MPKLKNIRHEAFAQAHSMGMSASDAYRATYGTNAKNINDLSARLSAKVSKRVIEIQSDAEHHTHLTIGEKRSMYARESKDRRNSLRDRLKAMEDDSKLAGHIKAAEVGGVQVNVNVAMLDEGRRAQLIEKKRAAIDRRKAKLISGNGNGSNGHN